MNKEEIKNVNKTVRTTKAIGKNAVLPKYIIDNYDVLDCMRILDFGAGPKAIHTKKLRDKGFLVDAYDIGDNSIKGVHINIDEHLGVNYNVIFVSNVMNILPTQVSMIETIGLIYYLLDEYGVALFNFPKTPRKIKITDNKFKEMLVNFFYTVNVEKYGSTKIYECWKGW